MIRPAARYGRRAESVAIVHRHPSPTSEVYLTPRLDSCPLPLRVLDVAGRAKAPPLDAGTFVIVTRYVNGAVLRRLEEAAPRLAGVAYLMDDDIPAALTDASLPLRYRLELAAVWLPYRRRLQRLVSEVWLSSEALMRRYDDGSGLFHRVDPAYVGPPPARHPAPAGRAEERTRLFYHGTTTHLRECLWLRDVLAEAKRRVPTLSIELFGRERVRRAFKAVPDCRILEPMPWPRYLEHCQSAHYDIGLAPLLPGRFNAARSYSKYLDIMRCGAVGIFGTGGPYEPVIRDGINGLLMPPDKTAWTEAVVALASDAALRQKMWQAVVDIGPPTGHVPPSLARLITGE